ncbi:hypothetical protein BZG35_15090 [Brevundimonas sp. LM2]|uniref:hypothetical protein n=1 Tax=Brevundimonas sp. LM2 TaxID=1938605 RepID=UPI000983D437|nr:hypothetical protein [Brevundimonas sp. LM2]AQR62831.1 hypothetical protein BZG35_15090 [Brevundimonas sp. LM2]
MSTKTEDMIERYLEAVAAQLPVDERDDIIAELRDLILSRVEAREETLGRPLTDDEREAILREIGHPLVVAARYRKGPDSLIGPELFPYWLYGVKAGLLVLVTLSAIGLFIRLVSGGDGANQAIGQAINGVIGSGLTLVGVLTVTGALMEHYGVRPKWLTDWRVKDLSAFGLSDPATWGLAARAAGERVQARAAAGRPAAGRRGCRARLTPVRSLVSEAAFSAVATGLFILWWVGLVSFPGLGTMRINGDLVTVTPAPVWTLLFVPILMYALAQLGVYLFTLIRPQAARMRALLAVVVGAAGLWLTWAIFDAGHWATLSIGAEQARIAGDWGLLDVDRLRELRDRDRDLVGVASMLSLIITWSLAISAVSLMYTIVANLWRAGRAEA